MKPRVLLDCDGPMAKFAKAYLRVLEEETGARHTVDEIDRWHIADCDWFKRAAVERGFGGAKALDKRLHERVVAPGFCSSIEPVDEAVKAVGELSKMAEVFVVTSPWITSPTWMHERTKWVREHFGIPHSHVIHASSKYLVHGDVLVDDKPSHVVEWGEQWGHGAALLFDMPHNRADGAGLRRVGWPEVLDVTWLIGAAGRLVVQAMGK